MAFNQGSEMTKKTSHADSAASKRLPPVRIPLDFDRAVEGLLAVDPKGPIAQKGAKKKPRRKK
jgi:hypothetical protein